MLALLALAGCDGRRGAERPALHGARIAFVLQDFVTVPPSNEAPPRARLNSLLPAPDGSHRLFVNDMTGRILVIEDGRVRPEPFLDMAKARAGSFTSEDLFEQGLNTFAFHPDFARPGQPGAGKMYTFSTERPAKVAKTFTGRLDRIAPAHHDVIAEWTTTPDGARVDVASRREVMRIAHPLHDHVGGQIAFNPRARPGEPDYGMLYIGIGDGGNTVFRSRQIDQWRTAQDRSLPYGKILRIDPLPAGSKPYRVPPDNPFVREAQALPEIWASGLRNPARFSWDTQGSGKLVIADIGQAQLEELDVGVPGANYGWSEREGSRMVRHDDETERRNRPWFDRAGRFEYPALVYGHHLGVAITGGFVYRGSALPELAGMYVFGDIASGRLFATPIDALENGREATFYELPLSYTSRELTLRQIVGAGRADLRLGIDDKGELYVLTKQDGAIRRLAAVVPARTAIWPVEHPADLLEPDTWWQAAGDRALSTLLDVFEWTKAVKPPERSAP